MHKFLFLLFPFYAFAQNDTLQEVRVNAIRSEMTSDPSKKVFQVGANLTNLGGNLYDVLSNIPSIYVTSDGNVNYRGNQNLTIYFDGKPAGILSSSRANALSLYPADQIDRIEIISNPGAKYSAEGSSGILNIILKKGSKTESLRLNSNLGTNDKYALSATYAKGYKRWTHVVDLNLRQNTRNNYQYLYRENPSPFGFSQIAQTTDEINRDYNQSIRLNSIYTFSKDRTFGISFIGRLSSDHNSEVRSNKSEFSYAADRFYARDADKKGSDSGFDLNLSYSPSANGKIDFLWIQNQGSDANQFYQHYFYGDFDTPNPNIPVRNERSSASSTNSTLLFQGDWTKSFSKKLSLDYGFKLNSRFFENSFLYEKQKEGIYVKDGVRSNGFAYEEHIQAGYVSFSKKARYLQLDGGIRVEATEIAGDVQQNYVNLFPSLSILHPISPSQSISFALSSRITRPSYKSLNPFISFADPLNLNAGNPSLKPEKALLLELSHVKDFTSLSVSNSLFYREITGLVGRVRTFLNGDTTLTRYENISKSRAWGLENLSTWTVSKAFKITLSSSIYQTDLQGLINGTQVAENRWSWNSRLNQQVKWKNNWSAQLSGIYQSSQINPLGIISPYYTVDLGVKKDLGRLTINARINDLFDTQKTIYDSRPFGFVSDLERKKETRIYYIGFSYKFESKKMKEGRERKRINEDEIELDDF
ncbi:TonB-dependent receptor [Aquirufa antheringensis]|uniref:outer membrane beta-barrel family protein n=1 Tax=Aquirufa antheringensis TaxID=2516559 RepID=UPI0022A8ACD2|nr:outer membrane beta-barrel family protein [Aquirufa antheringensis]MCZ2478263.1 TonB-dependent receptor [Aquirufa antheringensis]